MKYIDFLLLLVVASTGELSAQSGQQAEKCDSATVRKITINKAVLVALDSNFGLKSDSLEISVQSGNLQQSRLPENPEIILESDNARFAGGKFGMPVSIDIEKSFNPIARRKQSDVARYEVEIARANYMLQKQELIATVKNRFTVALACQEEVALADSLVILSNKVHTASVSQAIAGKVSFSDTLKSSAEFELARIQRDRMEQSRINAFQELASLWGSAQIDFKCEKHENNSRYVLPDSSALFAVLAESPQMKIAGSELNKKSAELRSEKAGRIPTVRAGGGIGADYGANEISPRVSLSFSIPLINWNQGAVNAAYHGVSQAEARCDAVRIETYNNVLSAYRNAARLQKEIHVFENVILPQSKEYLEAYFAAYVSGKMGILSLIEAQHSFFEVSRELAEINREYRLSIIDLGRYTVTRVPVTKPSMKD